MPGAKVMAEEDNRSAILVKPHSEEAESSVIASMIIDSDAVIKVMDILTEDDFYDLRYKNYFKAIRKLFNEKSPIDPLTVTEELARMYGPTDYGSLDYVGNMISRGTVTSNVTYYSNLVKEKSILRELINTNDEVSKKCYTNDGSLEEILSFAEKKVFDVVSKHSGGEMEDINQIVLKTLKSIKDASKNSGGLTGVPTGFIDLDEMTSGMHGGELILLAARPAMGKSALALNIASYCAINRGITTAVFSLEMPKVQLVKRIMSSVSKVSAGEINTGAIEPDAWGELMEGARKIAESGLVLDDTSGVTLMDLRSKCRKLKLEKNLGLIIIDYLQLMTGEKNAESRQNEIAGISRGLKVLARELDVPILALSQLSRGVESRTDKRPMLSDLRESGAIEQDADVVLFIYRDDYYNKESKEKGIAEVIISKQRSGPTGVVKLVWQPDYTRFRNISHEQ